MNWDEYINEYGFLSDANPTPFSASDWSKFIRNWKEANSWSYQDIADAYGIPARSLENWLTGKRTPPKYVMRLLYFAILHTHHVFDCHIPG